MSTQLDPNFIYATLKVGNKEISPTKPKHIGMKDGMFIDFVDPTEWSQPVFHSDNMKRVNAIIKYPRSYKSRLINALRYIKTAGKEREREAYISLSELETATGILNLESDLRGPGIVPLIDGKNLSTTLFKESSKKEWRKISDLNSVSSGNFGVGSGDDYTTWSAAAADIANLTGNLTFSQSSNTTDTGSASVEENLNSNILKFTNDTKPLGNPTTGFIASWSSNSLDSILPTTEGPGTFEIDGLYFKQITNANANTFIIPHTATVTFTCLIHDCLFDGNGLKNRAIRTLDSDILIHVYNALIWDQTEVAVRLESGSLNASSLFENMTVLNPTAASFFIPSGAATFRNIYAESGSSAAFLSHGSATGRNCASNDSSAGDGNWGTGSDNLTSEETSNFESVDDTSSDFAKVGAGNLAAGGSAVAISGHTVGIRGNAGGRAGSTPSIGADELAVSGGAARGFERGFERGSERGF